MLQCWLDEPKERPTFSKLKAKFDSLISTHTASYIDLMNLDMEQAYYNTLPTNNDNDFLVFTGLEQPYDHLNTEQDEQRAQDQLPEESGEKTLNVENGQRTLNAEEKEQKPYDHLTVEEDGQKPYDHLTAESYEMEEGTMNPAYSDSPTQSSQWLQMI